MAEPAPVTVLQVPIGRLLHHPRNVRASLGDLRELTGSIRQLGVLQPLLVERRGEVYRILAGHRRHAAARQAGLRTVPCMITRAVDDATALGLMLTENLQRAELTRAEKAAAARSLRDGHRRSVQQIADQLGVATSTVYGWLAEPTARAGTTSGPAPASPATSPLGTPRSSSPSGPRPPQLPGLNRTHATELHRLVAKYDRASVSDSFDRDVAGRALRNEVADLLGDWQPHPGGTP